MNKILFQQAGGFPLETDTLDFLQSAFQSLQALTFLGGDNYILSGCVVTGSNVSDGFVVINSELLPFKGGLVQTKVIVKENVTKKGFQNGSMKDAFFDRFAGFGTGADFVLFSDLVRIKDLKTFRSLPHTASSAIDSDSEDTLATSKAVKLLNDKISLVLPSGCILIWKGSIASIPAGFALCDGTAGTPNLTDKFILGAGNLHPVDETGGEKDHTLIAGELPTISVKAWQGHRTKDEAGGAQTLSSSQTGANPQSTLFSIGNNLAHNNMPPYYSLAYIMKL